ncbi:MAG: prepilin-type N-terminal cleavage/methylation domain-containing protein [Thermodesulfobacteriota bacterium]
MRNAGIMIHTGREGRPVPRQIPAGSGFTLLELMISMTILAMMVVILFGGFRVGVRAWEKGENDLDARQRQRIVLDLLRRQLASVCATEVLDPNGQEVLFRGGPRSMAFVSHVSLVPGSLNGLAYVTYAVDRDKSGGPAERLVFSETEVVQAGGTAAARNMDGAGYAELLSGAERIEFSYLKSRPDNREAPWQETWDPAVETAPPRAVRIMVKGSESRAPIYMIAAAGR